MRRSYVGIDVMKFIAAMLIVAIHIIPFQDVNLYLSYYFTYVICRIGVPFFFACAGYFLAEKITDWNAVKRYLLRLLQLYGIWTLLYLPQVIYQKLQNGVGVAEVLGDVVYSFFVTGSYTQFWYFPALIVTVVLLYLFKGKLKIDDRIILFISLILYLIGVMGNSYFGFLLHRQSVVTTCYQMIFDTLKIDKLGVFFGLFYVYMGYIIKKHEASVWCSSKNDMKYFWLFLACVVLMMIERKWLLDKSQYTAGDMTLVMMPTTFFLVQVCLNVKGSGKKENEGLWLRQASTLVFGSHLFVNFYIHKLLTLIGLENWMQFSLYRFVVVCVGSLCFATVVIGLSKIKVFNWLSKLY